MKILLPKFILVPRALTHKIYNETVFGVIYTLPQGTKKLFVRSFCPTKRAALDAGMKRCEIFYAKQITVLRTCIVIFHQLGQWLISQTVASDKLSLFWGNLLGYRAYAFYNCDQITKKEYEYAETQQKFIREGLE
jgi:hypothetical protein